MRPPKSVKALEQFGRVRLSKTFFMRDFLYSEISQIEGIPNIPENPDLAIEVGTVLCTEILEPIQARFGRIAIRSALRAAAINAKGAENKNQYNCARNEANRSRHIWDLPDKNGKKGAKACIVVPSFLDYYARDERRNWRALAWWIHDHVPYSSMEFFPRLCAFSVGWHEAPAKTIHAWKPARICLTKPGMPNHSGSHGAEYAEWLGEHDRRPGAHR